jgi:hypothetical protein
MGRWLTAAGGLALAVWIACGGVASAAVLDRGPVCRLPSVVDEMTREVRDHDYYSEIDPRLVTETLTPDPNVVRCQVCVQSAPYDTTRAGDRPIRQCLEHGFEVRILQSGFVVRDLKLH